MDRAMRSVEQINLKATEREALRRAATILRSRFSVERIIRFGSKARGIAGPIRTSIFWLSPPGLSIKRRKPESLPLFSTCRSS